MIEARTYEGHFRALHRGDATFGEFARATEPLWRRMAAQIHRRWRVPEWYSVEETRQNLLLGAWQHVWSYDPAKGRSIQRYVIWNAYDRAKKAAHVARCAKRSGNADRAPSHVERPLSSYGDEADDGGELAHAVERLMHGAGAYTEPDQERALIEAEERREGSARVWAQASTWPEVRAMEALAAAGSLEEAARAMWADRGVRAELRLAGPTDAERVVRRAARAVAERLSA